MFMVASNFLLWFNVGFAYCSLLADKIINNLFCQCFTVKLTNKIDSTFEYRNFTNKLFHECILLLPTTLSLKKI